MYLAWTMLKIHPPTYDLNPNLCNDRSHIRYVLLVDSTPPHLSVMRNRSYKSFLKQSSCHPNKFSICLVSKTQYEHITFMIIYCNMDGGG